MNKKSNWVRKTKINKTSLWKWPSLGNLLSSPVDEAKKKKRKKPIKAKLVESLVESLVGFLLLVVVTPVFFLFFLVSQLLHFILESDPKEHTRFSSFVALFIPLHSFFPLSPGVSSTSSSTISETSDFLFLLFLILSSEWQVLESQQDTGYIATVRITTFSWFSSSSLYLNWLSWLLLLHSYQVSVVFLLNSNVSCCLTVKIS